MTQSQRRLVELIELKRDGGTFSDAEIHRVIDQYTDGTMPDYQMAALLMAVFFNGLKPDELATWTEAMLSSGDRIDLSRVAQAKVDKHSTGGVGDKVSIPLAPLVASCGVAVPMMSGRGLGHTGGTLDKLESIEGFRTDLDPDTFVRLVRDHGFAMAGQTERLVPADRKLYALRDATATVPSIPLIASSIMSKKLAEGLDALVLDVKTGSGAFMTDQQKARELAETMVGIGRSHGVATRALLTSMDQPLGMTVGNANEVEESIDVLRGEGPADLTEIVIRLGAEMLQIGGVVDSEEEGRFRLERAVADGSGLERFRQIVIAQGGNVAVIDDPKLLPQAEHTHVVTAPDSGMVARCDARMIGVAAMRLGAGRETKEDTIDPAVGVRLVAKIGAEVKVGDPLAIVHYNDADRLPGALELLDQAWAFSSTPIEPPPLVIDTLGP